MTNVVANVRERVNGGRVRVYIKPHDGKPGRWADRSPIDAIEQIKLGVASLDGPDSTPAPPAPAPELSSTRAALTKKAEDLGIKVDNRWGLDRIQRCIHAEIEKQKEGGDG